MLPQDFIQPPFAEILLTGQYANQRVEDAQRPSVDAAYQMETDIKPSLLHSNKTPVSAHSERETER